MPLLRLDFGTGQSSSVDELAAPEASPLLMNAVVDAGGTVMGRPGIKTYWTGPTTGNGDITGVTVWNGMNIYARADRRIFVMDDLDTLREVSSATDVTTQLEGTGRPVFAHSSTRLDIAGGGAPQKITGAAPALLVSARVGGSPPVMTHIVAIGQRLVGNENNNSGNKRWSNSLESGYDTWGALATDEAESRPDKLVGVYENTRNLWLFGATSLEIESVGEDPTFPFELADVVNAGCGAAYSPIRWDDAFAWLDERSRFVASPGRSVEVLSSPDITRTVRALGTVSDCWGYREQVGHSDSLVWMFPTEGRGFAFETNSKKWSERSAFSGGDYTRWPVNSYAFNADTRQHYVGTSNGAGLHQLDTDTYSDLGATLKIEARSGFADAGSIRNKCWQSLRLRMRRGAGAYTGTPPYVNVSWRGDLGAWSTPRRVSLGTSGDVAVTGEVQGLGISRQIQARIEMTDAVRFALVAAELEYEEMVT